jgi:four helix bundle protein
MTPQELRERTMRFAVAVNALVKAFRAEPAAALVTAQLLRSATSTAANYRSAGQARSHAEFRSKISLVLEEADECIHWLEFAKSTDLSRGPELEQLLTEARELAAIFGASRRTATQNAKTAAASRKTKS